MAIHAGLDESARESARFITNPSELIKRVKWSSRACTTHDAANVRAVNPIIYGFTRVEWRAKRFKWLGDRNSSLTVMKVHHVVHRSKIVSRCCSKACKHVSRA